MSNLQKHIERVMTAARAEYDGLRERALDELERHFGISRDRVNEHGELDVSPEEFARMQSTSVQLARYEEPSPLRVTDFQIKVIVVKPAQRLAA